MVAPMGDAPTDFLHARPARFIPGELRGGLVDTERSARYRWAAELMAGRRVLNVGCGVGEGSAILMDAGAREVVGVDAAPAVVEAAQAAARPGLRFEHCDLRQLPYPDASFDAVVWFDPGEGSDAVLDELARVLSAEGVIATLLPGAGADEFEAAVARHWPHVRLLDQRNWLASSVTAEPLEQVQVRGEPGAEGHTVALASASELPPSGAPVAAVTGLADLRSWLDYSDEQQRALDEQRLHLQQLNTMERERAELRARLIEAEAQGARALQLEVELGDALEETSRERDDLRRRLETSEQILRDVMGSPSWKLTKPLRSMKNGLRSRLD